MPAPVTFPNADDTLYEVWECADGVPVRLACRTLPAKVAVSTAAEWTAEAHENYLMESRGPVKPTVRKTFVAVKVQMLRTLVAD